jgi:hypothetical protein
MLEKATCGLGEHYCKTSSLLRTELNNTEITLREANALKAKIQKHFKAPKAIKIEFSNRKYPHTWGSAWVGSRRIKVYRHSVGVVLHELAHVLTCDLKEHHGKRFAAILDECIETYQALGDTPLDALGIARPKTSFRVPLPGKVQQGRLW